MLQNFVSDSEFESELSQIITRPVSSSNLSERSGRSAVRILVYGTPPDVDYIIRDLHARHFAEFGDWSPPIQSSNPGIIWRILVKYISITG